jgi:serine/threonine protein kinase
MEKSSSEDAYNIELTDGNLLGEGSYGQVFKIKRKVDGLMCAAKLLKIPLDQMNTNEQLGYKRESKILKQSDHPFIV